MNEYLVRILVERNLINQNTEIEAMYNAHDLGGKTQHQAIGTFAIVAILRKDDKISFRGRSITDGDTVKIPSEHIIKIDGMVPARFASIYNLGEQGEYLKPKKRRGRKPKGWTPEMEQAGAPLEVLLPVM